jgi:flagellar P-ring protein precursor FlgI
MKINKIKYIIIFIIFLIFLTVALYGEVAVKIGDISFIDGLKNNQAVGYGLVVGLQGTGDSKSALTASSLKNLLKNLGMEGDQVQSKNCAAVIISTQLPPFVRIGDRLDLTVSSIGDAKSLEGGILIQSPLRGADNKIYVVGQGALSVAQPKSGRTIKTVATISNGGIVEREIVPEIVSKNNSIFLVLKNWDYTVANNIIKAISNKYPGSSPSLKKNARIEMKIVNDVGLAEFISSVQNLQITTMVPARIIINEKDGTIVTGGNVKISESLISRDGLTVEIEGTSNRGAAAILKEAASVKELVDSLNAIGASTTDIIAILKGLKEAGSLHADLIIK